MLLLYPDHGRPIYTLARVTIARVPHGHSTGAISCVVGDIAPALAPTFPEARMLGV